MKLEWKNVLSLLTVLVGWSVFFPTIGAGQLYKWTDAQGNLHITDVPPPANETAPVAKVKPRPHVSPPAPPPKQTSIPPQAPVQGKRAKVVPAPAPMDSLKSSKKKQDGVRVPLAGLKPEQATIASPWEVMDRKRGNAKVGVQRWTDGKGIDHFSDVLSPGHSGED